jgi:hypothetical protein
MLLQAENIMPLHLISDFAACTDKEKPTSFQSVQMCAHLLQLTPISAFSWLLLCTRAHILSLA